MLSISLTVSVHIWCGLLRVVLARVIVCYRLLCDPREQVMFWSDPEPVLFPPCNFLLPHLQRKKCKLLLQIARLLSKVKVAKLFAHFFAPIKSVHEQSCEKSFQTFTFFATFCSHKKRCKEPRRAFCVCVLLIISIK